MRELTALETSMAARIVELEEKETILLKTSEQRDMLLAALESVISWMDDPEDGAFSDEQLSIARAAIAKAKGE